MDEPMMDEPMMGGPMRGGPEGPGRPDGKGPALKEADESVARRRILEKTYHEAEAMYNKSKQRDAEDSKKTPGAHDAEEHGDTARLHREMEKAKMRLQTYRPELEEDGRRRHRRRPLLPHMRPGMRPEPLEMQNGPEADAYQADAEHTPEREETVEKFDDFERDDVDRVDKSVDKEHALEAKDRSDDVPERFDSMYKNTYGEGIDYGEHDVPGNLQALDHEAEAGSAGTEEEYEDSEMGS